MPGAKAKVFVVWEPITFGDFNLPPDSALQRIPDTRAAQYFDQNHLVSKALRVQMLAQGVTGEDYFVRAKNVWDAVAVFAPGKRWETGAGATPDFVGAPDTELQRAASRVVALAIRDPLAGVHAQSSRCLPSFDVQLCLGPQEQSEARFARAAKALSCSGWNVFARTRIQRKSWPSGTFKVPDRYF